MPGDPPRAAAALPCPEQRVLGIEIEPIGFGIAADDIQICVLVAGGETQAEPESVGQRQPVVHRIARIDRIVLFRHVALNDSAAVGGHGKAHIRRARHRPAFEQRAQRARRAAGFGPVKSDIVDEHQEAPVGIAQLRKQPRKPG